MSTFTRNASLRGSLAVVLSLCMVGCNQSALATAFDRIAIGVDAGVVVLNAIGPSAGIPPAVLAQVSRYLSDVADAMPKVQAELNSSDPLGVQLVKISDILTPYLAREIPGAPPNLVAIVHAVGSAIQTFLGQLKSTQTALSAAQPGMQGRRVAEGPYVLSPADQRAVSKSVVKAQKAKAKLGK